MVQAKPKMMVNFHCDHYPTGLEEVMQMFGLSASQIDDNFGIVDVDPEDNLYAVLVDQHAAEKIWKSQALDAPVTISGDVKISTFEM